MCGCGKCINSFFYFALFSSLTCMVGSSPSATVASAGLLGVAVTVTEEKGEEVRRGERLGR